MIPILFCICWGLLSIGVCWMAGRFIRIGMTELQPQKDVDARELDA